MRTFPNPYLRCNACQEWVTGYEPGKGFVSCGHKIGSTSACPTFTPRDGCVCDCPHPSPPSAKQRAGGGE